MFATILVIGVLLMFGLLSVGVLTLARRGAVAQGVAPAPATVVANDGKKCKDGDTVFTPAMKKFMIWGTAATLLVFTALWLFGGVNWGPGAFSGLQSLIAIVLILGLVVAAFYKKGGKIAQVVAVLVVGSLIIFGGNAFDVWKKTQNSASQFVLEDNKSTTAPAEVPAAAAPSAESRPAQAVTHHEASWEAKGETLPVGVWSEVTEVGVGCSVQFAFGNGHRVQYRYYSREWSDYEAGTSPNASELRFMVTEEGITNLPYTVKCN